MRKAFTLVEALITFFVVGVLFVGLMTYFSTSLQQFTQQESTLTGSRDAQILLSYLRDDIRLADGEASSSSASTGTTFPKLYRHLTHHVGSDILEAHHFQKRSDSTPIPSNAPLAQNLPSGPRTQRLKRQISCCENAFAWVDTRQNASSPEPVYFVINRRDGNHTEKVVYTYYPHHSFIERSTTDRTTRIALPTLVDFWASPTLEFITFPGNDQRTAELAKVWVEVAFALRARQGGAKIKKRQLHFSTNVTPKYLNARLKSIWNR